MRDTARWPLLALALLAIGALPVGVARATFSSATAFASPVDSPETTASTAPEPTIPSTSPATDPDDSSPVTSTPDTLVAAGEPDDNIDATTTSIAVVGFLLLLAIASWWMVRRSDPDAEPMPRTPNQSELPGDLI